MSQLYVNISKLQEKGVVFKDREKNDYYPTSPNDVVKALSLINNKFLMWKVLDVGCGNGVWGEQFKNYINNEMNIKPQIDLWGVDIQEFNKNDNFDHWIMNYNFLNDGVLSGMDEFDLIIGNPPYKHAQEFVERSFDLLGNGGQVIMLLRLAFLESQKRHNWFKEFTPNEVMVYSKRPSFTGDGKTYPIAFAAFSWLKNYDGETKLSWCI